MLTENGVKIIGIISVHPTGQQNNQRKFVAIHFKDADGSTDVRL
jgi:hypothetical protein